MAIGNVRLATRLLPDDSKARIIAASALVGSLGYGLYTTGSLFYFTRSVGLSLADVGAGLSISAIIGLLLSVPAGRLSDRWGHRETSIASGLAQAAVLVASVFVTTFAEFLVVISLLGVAEQVGNVARGAVLATVTQGAGRVHLSAYVRSVVNAGITGGIFVAGLALAVDTRAAYLSLMLGNAVCALIGCLLFLRLPRQPPAPAMVEGPKPTNALRDLPYFAVAVLTGIVMLSDACLVIGLPLWIANYTDAPRPLAAWLLAVNTGLVIALQTRASKRVRDLASARQAMILATVTLAVACGLFVLGGRTGWLLAAVILLAGVVVLSLGEMWASAAGWSFRYDLAHEQRQGAYGAIFDLGTSLRMVIGPAAITLSLQHLRGWAWLVFGLMFLAAAAAIRPVLAWAVRSRPWTAGQSEPATATKAV